MMNLPRRALGPPASAQSSRRRTRPSVGLQLLARLAAPALVVPLLLLSPGCSKPPSGNGTSGATAGSVEAPEPGDESGAAGREPASSGPGGSGQEKDKEGLNLGGVRVKLRVDNDRPPEKARDPFARPPEPVQRPKEKDSKGRRVEARD